MTNPISPYSSNINFSNERLNLNSKNTTTQADSIESQEPGLLTKACALTFLLVPLSIILIPYFLVRDLFIMICGSCEEKPTEQDESNKLKPFRDALKLYIDKTPHTPKIGNAETVYEVADKNIFDLAEEFTEDPLLILDLQFSASKVKEIYPEFNRIQTLLKKAEMPCEVYFSPPKEEVASHILISYRDQFSDGSTNTYIMDGIIFRGINSEKLEKTKARIDLQLQAAIEQQHTVLLIQVSSSSDLTKRLYQNTIAENYPGCFEKVIFVPIVKAPEEVKKAIVAKKPNKIHTMADLKKD